MSKFVLPKYSKEATASYIIRKNGDLVEAVNGSTGKVEFLGTDALAVVQSAVDALPSYGGVILIKDAIDSGTGQLIINRTNVAIKTGYIRKDNVGGPIRLRRILIDSTSQPIKQVYLSGFDTNELILNANNNPILIAKLEGISFRCFNTYGAAIKTTGNSYVMDVAIVDCAFHSYEDQGNGTINFASLGEGTGQWWLSRCRFKDYVDGTTFMVENGGGASVILSKFSYEQFYNAAKFIVVKSNGKGFGDLKVVNSYFEHHKNVTLYTIESGTNIRFSLVHSGNRHTNGIDGSYTTTFINNTNTSWNSGYCNGVITRNNFIHKPTKFIIGTTGASSNFRFNFDHNIGYVTENSGIATFSGNGTQTVFTIAHGLAGAPKSWRVEAGSADAKGDKYVTADSTNLTVTFATAPPSGTNNVVLVWSAEM